MSKVVFDARFDQLSSEQRKGLWEWRDAVEAKERKQGLWVVGKRCSGTSYIANVAMRRMLEEHVDWDWDRRTAEELIQMQRSLWTATEQMRHNDDYAVWQEYAQIEYDVHFFMERAEIAWVDDFHDTVNTKFWRSHVQGGIESRVKDGKPTIVATVIAPNHREFADITRVIESLFVIVHATR